MKSFKANLEFFRILQFEIYQKISTNIIYSQKLTKADRVSLAYTFGVLVNQAVKKSGLKPIKKYPLILYFKFFLSGRLLDSSNTSFMAKMIEDGLESSGIIKDDSKKYIKCVVLEAEKIQGKHHFVEIWVANPDCIKMEV